MTPLVNQTDQNDSDSVAASPDSTNYTDSLERSKEMASTEETTETPRSSSPPNPFDESEEEEDSQTQVNGNLPSTADSLHEEASRPVPAPRRVSEPTPPPRPAPRVRLPRTSDGLTVGVCRI